MTIQERLPEQIYIASDFPTGKVQFTAPAGSGNMEINYAAPRPVPPTLLPSEKVIDVTEIVNKFSSSDFAKVFDFLIKSNLSVKLILEANDAISQEFEKPNVSLDLIEEPGNHEYDYLVISVFTDLDAEEANEKLSSVNNNWFYPNYLELGGKLSIYLEYL